MVGDLLSTRPSRKARPAHKASLVVEMLETRCVLSGNVLQTNLVSDLPGVATFQDANLVNPWGIATSDTSPLWISDNGSSLSTLYNTAGTAQALMVKIPSPGDPLGASGTPTGTVFNTTLSASNPGFRITNGTTTAPAVFLFATEDGTIIGWAPSVDGTHGIIAVPTTAHPGPANGAVYKGLTLATDSSGHTLLYAANFSAGTIDVYDTSFNLVTTLPAGAFTDPSLPKGYAPFNVQAIGNKIYVTYAKQDDTMHDDVSGPHHGFVNVFNLDGSGQQRLVSGGVLNSPWGLTIAPGSFGTLADSLLVGNFGDGRIHAFDPATGALLGTLQDPDGEAIEIDGLWALRVGNGGNGGAANNVYFTAGLDDEKHGLFGSLAPVDPGTSEGLAESQALRAKLDIVEIDLQNVATDIANGVTGSALKQALHDLHSAVVDLHHAERDFAHDIRADLRMSLSKPPKLGKAQQSVLDSVFADMDN